MILTLRNKFVDAFILALIISALWFVIGYSWSRSNAEMERFEYCQKALTQARASKVTFEYCLK